MAVRRGLDRVPGVGVALIADLVRNRGPEHGLRNLEEIAEVRDCGVIGIGIGGAEHDFPPEPFAPVYARARELGFHTTAHAGEAAGAASIWGALNVLRVERIGHGTRAYEDPRLLRRLAETQMPLEMCPLSNVRTKVVGAIEEHPIRRYVSEGLLVTVNTDDPKLFGNSLAEEYRLLQDRLGFTSEELQALTLNGIRALMATRAAEGCAARRVPGGFRRRVGKPRQVGRPCQGGCREPHRHRDPCRGP